MQAFIRYVLTSGEKGTANSANSIQEVFRKYKLCAKKKKKNATNQRMQQRESYDLRQETVDSLAGEKANTKQSIVWSIGMVNGKDRVK